jgi:hypothetical protein
MAHRTEIERALEEMISDKVGNKFQGPCCRPRQAGLLQVPDFLAILGPSHILNRASKARKSCPFV